MYRRIKLALIFILSTGCFFSNTVEADDPSLLTLGVGAFDFNREKDQGMELRVDYRSDKKIWEFKPFLTGAIVTNGMSFFGAGLLLDVYFGNRFVATPSIAPTWWHGASDDLDLGHGLEFRSQIEFAYRFDDRSRFGLAVSHSSNASIGDTNPGTESLMLNYSYPFEKIPFEEFFSR